MKKIIFLLTTLLFPALSWAHPNHLGDHGFLAGILHPLTGLDHTLAMIAVGMLASQKGKLWAFPMTFIAFMIIGGLIGYMGISVPWVEIGISLSVLVLGLWVVFPNILPTICLLTALATFALCHGFAHGTEMDPGHSLVLYVTGFILATALLHLAGIISWKMIIKKGSFKLKT